MCGRYGLYDLDQFTDRYGLPVESPEIKPNWNAAPGQFMPVVTAGDDGQAVEIMKWGLVPFWAKDTNIGYKMINARAESAFDKPAWREPIRHHRCLIPANGFYEWKHLDGKKTKQPYYIYPKDQPLFSFAGICSTWKGSDGQPLQTYAIMTTAPNKEMTVIHDRMPVILHPDDETIWLDRSLEQEDVLQELLRPYPNNGLDMHEVSTDVNLVKNNDGYLVKPINSK